MMIIEGSLLFIIGMPSFVEFDIGLRSLIDSASRLCSHEEKVKVKKATHSII